MWKNRIVLGDGAIIAFGWEQGRWAARVHGAQYAKDRGVWTIPLPLLRQDAQALQGAWGVGEAEPAVEDVWAFYAEGAYPRATQRLAKAIPSLWTRLWEVQQEAAVFAFRWRKVVIALPMGTGKTVAALAAMQGAGAFPLLCIVPAFLREMWQEVCREWIGREAGMRREGMEHEVVVVGFEEAMRHQDPLMERGFRGMIIDESHACANWGAKRTVLCASLAKRIPRVIALTGTPIVNRVRDLMNQLAVIGAIDESLILRRIKWRIEDEGQRRSRSGSGNRRTQPQIVVERELLSPERLSRLARIKYVFYRQKSEVLPYLPPITHNVVDVPPLPRCRQEEQDFVDWIAAEVRRRRRISVRHIFARLLVLRQLAYESKRETVIRWALAQRQKTVVFTWHRAAAREIADALGAPCAHGGIPVSQRYEMVRRFQEDQTVRTMVCTMRSTGVGISLTAAAAVAFAELPWNAAWLDQAVARVHRAGQTQPVSATYFLTMEGIDQYMWEVIVEKRTTAEAILRGAPYQKTLERVIQLYQRRAYGYR
ncbi:MAG: DEAD/DEAH box helicase [Candidatus Caldarchaeum sp.]